MAKNNQYGIGLTQLTQQSCTLAKMLDELMRQKQASKINDVVNAMEQAVQGSRRQYAGMMDQLQRDFLPPLDMNDMICLLSLPLEMSEIILEGAFYLRSLQPAGVRQDLFEGLLLMQKASQLMDAIMREWSKMTKSWTKKPESTIIKLLAELHACIEKGQQWYFKSIQQLTASNMMVKDLLVWTWILDVFRDFFAVSKKGYGVLFGLKMKYDW